MSRRIDRESASIKLGACHPKAGAPGELECEATIRLASPEDRSVLSGKASGGRRASEADVVARAKEAASARRAKADAAFDAKVAEVARAQTGIDGQLGHLEAESPVGRFFDRKELHQLEGLRGRNLASYDHLLHQAKDLHQRLTLIREMTPADGAFAVALKEAHSAKSSFEVLAIMQAVCVHKGFHGGASGQDNLAGYAPEFVDTIRQLSDHALTLEPRLDESDVESFYQVNLPGLQP